MYKYNENFFYVRSFNVFLFIESTLGTYLPQNKKRKSNLKSSGFEIGFASNSNFSESTTETNRNRHQKKFAFAALHESFSANYSKLSHLRHLPKNIEMNFYALRML
jgi:hypothetical protein